MNTSASKAVNTILEAFENGNLPQAIAHSTFNPPSNIPAYKWTRRNRAIAFLQNTGDARGFNQWKEAGRYVKKGSTAIYILGPVLKKTNDVIEIEDPATGEVQRLEDKKCVGYHAIPVFRMEDTEGEPLEYAPLDPKSLPLADVALSWGLEVKAGAFNGAYYAYYSGARQEIVMATDDESVFFHELAHAAHYRIDQNAAKAPAWEKELIAELSAAALCQMFGKTLNTGNHYRYIKHYAEEAKLSPVKACMKILDTCLQVIEAIAKEADNLSSVQKAA
jgi:antirestriction protein ArdC